MQSFGFNCFEYCGRNGAGIKKTVHFLHIAKGSCAEVRTQVLIASKINYISADDFEVVKNEEECISRMLYGLIKSITPKT